MAVTSDSPPNSPWLSIFALQTIAVFLLLSFAASVSAQTQASCTFAQFSVRSQTSTGIRTLGPGGINDYRTVVGYADNSNGLSQGFVRWSSGALSFYTAKPSAIAVDTFFSDRNNNGVMIGLAGIPFSLHGSTFTRLVLTIGTNTHTMFAPVKINNWGTIVGYYSGSSGAIHGFKRWSNGQAIALDFPGAKETFPLGINDHGTIVGWYSNTLPPDEHRHGFIYHNGQWTKLDYPSITLQTTLTGIDNAGLIIGSTVAGSVLHGSFIYVNGVFKKVIAPNSTVPTVVSGISLIRGLLTGISGFGGFVATCK
jgi:hypothetical protein